MPIFYDMDPSEVRTRKRKFGKTFAKLVARKALIEASNIAGWEPKHIANGYESKVIKEIVDKIQDRLFPLDSDVDEELVGMRARLQDLISQLKIGSGGVRMVGIWGIGGSGKTTLAFSVYMEISRHFQGHCFISDIREQSKHGLETLQQKFLSTVLKTKVKVQSVEEGKHIIKSRLRNSKVLVLLDDVDDLGQLEALVGSHKWFGGGSRIIITTRDEHLLNTHRVDHISLVRLLSNQEATRLFYKHAYNEKEPLTNYEKHSLSVVSYAAGLPLALKVLGSFLYDKDENEWISALTRLKDIPNIKIMDILKISYDGLETLQKELFLDIACFFRGCSTNITREPMEILDACGFHPVIGIKVLRQKSLITIDDDGMLDMHDLVQELGHYIVRGQHPNNVEKHSRVWKDEEISNMCYRDSRMENHKIEAVEYFGHSSRFGKMISNLKKLRWLRYLNYGSQDDYDDDDGDDDNDDGDENEDGYRKYVEVPSFLSNELRYLYWERYPASPFPDSFQPMNLIVLKLHKSLQKELWNGCKHLPHLKVLELHSMWNLLSTPDFDGLPSLKKLELYYCWKLEKIDPSLGNHRSLEYLSVSLCGKLRIFPMIIRMEKLNTLEIMCCKYITELPYIQANMESLVKVSLKRANNSFPDSSIANRCMQVETVFHQLTHILHKLNFSSLRKLNLSGWGLKDGEIPSDIGKLSNLEGLDLSWNNFSRLDFSLSHLIRLRFLCMSNCKRLVELPKLPSSVSILEADYCDSLTAMGNSCRNCKRLYKVSLVGGGIVIDGSRLLPSMFLGRDIENHCIILQLEGLEIPKRLLPGLARGTTCILQLPENWCNDFCGFLMCVACTSDYIPQQNMEIRIEQVMNGGMGMDSHYDDEACTSDYIPQQNMEIRMEQVMSGGMGMDSQYDDEAWKESAGDKTTWVGYVPFGMLRHTSWWNETHSLLSVSIGEPNKCSVFRFGLIPSRSGFPPTTETSTDSPPDFFLYTPTLRILHDSASALNISLNNNSSIYLKFL